jgi:hypothetical protein
LVNLSGDLLDGLGCTCGGVGQELVVAVVAAPFEELVLWHRALAWGSLVLGKHLCPTDAELLLRGIASGGGSAACNGLSVGLLHSINTLQQVLVGEAVGVLVAEELVARGPLHGTDSGEHAP